MYESGLSGADMGACAMLPRVIGQGRAAELLYTGRAMHGEEAANCFGDFGTRGSGGSDAGVGNLCGRDSCGGAGLAYRLMERFAGLRFAGTEDVAGSGGCGGEEL